MFIKDGDKQVEFINDLDKVLWGGVSCPTFYFKYRTSSLTWGLILHPTMLRPDPLTSLEEACQAYDIAKKVVNFVEISLSY